MNLGKDYLIAVIIGGLFVAGLTAFLAVQFSPVVAGIFCVIMIVWICFAVWYTQGTDRSELESGAKYEHYMRKKPMVGGDDPRSQIPNMRTRVPLAETSPAKPKAEGSGSAEAPPVHEATGQPGYRQSLVDGTVEIQKLVNKNNEILSRYESVMSKRLHKTVSEEHRAMITARKIVSALEERIALMTQTVEDCDNGKADERTVRELLKAPLIVPHDPLTALPGEQPLPPISPAAFESTLRVLCKQIARKPSFLQILRISD